MTTKLRTATAGLLLLAGVTGALAGCSASSAPGGSDQGASQAPATPPDLTGDWKQSNSKSADSYQEATISGTTIEIDWVSDGGNTKSLYWAGSFTPPTTDAEPYKWTSNNDTSKTSSAMLASGDPTKEFTYQDGAISYSASALGTTTTVELKKNG